MNHVLSPSAERTSPKLRLYGTLVLGLVLAICLATTWSVWRAADDEVRHKARDLFEQRTLEIERTFRHRLAMLESILHGAEGLFAAVDPVTRHAWRTYTKGLGTGQFFPAVRTIGYAEHVPATARPPHERRLRNELGSYGIWPEQQQAEYAPVVFVEHFLAAGAPPRYGFDMRSDPSRRAALVRARDSGETAISNRVLPLSSARDPGAIFMMLRAVYHERSGRLAVEQRRAALRGYVSLDFDLAIVVSRLLKTIGEDLRVEIFDGDGTAKAARVFDSHAALDAASSTEFASITEFEYAGKRWTVRYQAAPPFEARLDRSRPQWVLGAGAAVTVLMLLIVWSLVTTRARAVALADRMTAALRENEVFTGSVVENAVDGMIVIEERGVIQSFNKAAEGIFGYSAHEVVGKNVSMLMPSPDRERHDRYLANYLATGEKKIIGIGREVTALRKNGEEFPVDLAVSEAVLRGKRGFVGTVRDITQRRRAEQQILGLNRDLLRRTTELGEMNKELEAFSYSVSHDLRAPLRAIDGYALMLEEDHAAHLDAEGKRTLSVVRGEAQRMGQLIDDLLAFSRWGRSTLANQEVDMATLVRAVVDELTPAATSRPQLAVREMPKANGDPVLLRQVWVNLISNAIKFTGPCAQPQIEIGGHRDGERCVYFVRDNGVGFDMRYYDKLFGVFQRFHRAEDFPGSGVGLAIVSRIVSRHGGTVWAEGKVDGGATFYFALPKEKAYELD